MKVESKAKPESKAEQPEATAQIEQLASPPAPEKPADDEVTALKAALAAEKARVAGYEAEAKKRADAELTEAERLKKQLSEAEQKAQQLASDMEQASKRHSFALAAREAGCLDVDLAFGTLAADALTVSDGKVLGVEKALKTLREAKPFLFGAVASGSAGNGAVLPGGGQVSADAIRAMSAEEFVKFRSQVRSGKIKL